MKKRIAFIKTRLAKKEYEDTVGISISKRYGFGTCTLHGHDFYELDIIAGGKAPITFNGKADIAERGKVYFLSPEDFHEYPTQDKKDILNIHFAIDAVSSNVIQPILESKNRIYTPTAECFENISRIVDIMLKLDSEDRCNAGIMSRLLESVLLMLLKSDAEREPLYRFSDSKSDMQKAILYIRENFKENPTLSEVAAVVSLNERYFCSKFKKYTGQNYKNYLKSIKLRYAARLMKVTSISVAEVATRCGYNSQSHFNREFKEYYGDSPLKMRHNKA